MFLLQKGRFNINNIDELDNLEVDKNGIKSVIDLEYMGKIQYEGNAVAISRLIIEYFREDYEFIPMNVYNKNNEELFIFIDKVALKEHEEVTLQKLYEWLYERVYSLYDHINGRDNGNINFWWSLDSNYMLFFGEEKIEIINYFLDACTKRDGKKEEIEKKLQKVGYRIIKE